MRFLGIGIQTDVKCAGGTLQAFLEPRALTRANAVESPTEPEALVFGVPRDGVGVEHITEGRVARTTFSDGTMDREWDIIAIADGSDTDELVVTCQPIALRLGRVIYMGLNAADSSPEPRFLGGALTVAEWVTELVIPAVDAAGLTWVNAGTYDSTARFPLEGEWASVLEIVRAFCAAGRANGEWQLRRNGDTDYKLDVLNSIGASSAAFTLHTRINLLSTKRERSLVDVATRLVPQLSGAEAAWRTLAYHLFRIKTVVSGTVLELDSWDLSAGPIAFDNQLNGLRLAVLNSHTWSAQTISASVASTQRVTVPSTAGMSSGQLVRFFPAPSVSAPSGYITSLAHPTRVLAPSAGGYGDRAMILPMGELQGVSNYVPNPWMRTWTTPAAAPDGWTSFASTPANVAFSQATTEKLYAGFNTYRMVVNTGFTASGGGARPNVACCIETPDVRVWALTAARYVVSCWVRIQAVGAQVDNKMLVELLQGNTVIATLGEWVRGSTPNDVGTWVRYVSAPLNLSAITGVLRVRVSLISNTTAVNAGWDVRVGPALIADSLLGGSPDDVEGAPASAAWQAANRRLATTSSPIKGYDVAVADLARDDAAVFAAYRLHVGAQGTVVDTDLGETVAVRLLEYRPDYLEPLMSSVRVGAPFDTLSSWQAELLALTPRTPDPAPADDPLDVRCNIAVTAISATQVSVTVTGTASRGVPVIQLLALSGGATIASGSVVGLATASGSSWTFNLPASRTGPALARFVAYLSATDRSEESITLTEVTDAALNLTECFARVTAVSLTQIEVTVTAISTTGTPQVKLVAIRGTATRASGPTLGTASASGSVWVFNRGSFSDGPSDLEFATVLAGAIADTDYVQAPEQGRDTVPLQMRARITASDANNVTVRVAVADPYPQGAASVSISYLTQGIGTVSPTSPQTCTPASTITEAAGTYVDFTVPRPAYGDPLGRITFTAVASNRTSDSDAVDVPAKNPQPASLNISTRIYTDEYVITWSGVGTVLVSIDGGSYAAPATSPITVARNAYGGLDKTYAFKATGVGGDVVAQTVFVLKKEYVPPATPFFSAFSITDIFKPGDGGGYIELTWTLDNPPSGVDFDIIASGVTGSSITASGATAYGVTTSPYSLTIALAADATGDVFIEAYDGATLVASANTSF